ncbi:hypothetical protein [Hahella sp. HN01]|uniref:hypothetical protein n=1 Tax=Hahella sp. HN01 TaxID=2847262 RepID=UPI001C1ED566|nr:hypothetical protein [Hahella sp. HN01]
MRRTEIMNAPQFDCVEQIGAALAAHWYNALAIEISPGQQVSRLLATGDDVEMCLGGFEWICDGEERAALIGLPDKDPHGAAIALPESVNDGHHCLFILNLAALIANKIGASDDFTALQDSQITDDLISMLKTAIEYEMLHSLGDVKRQLEQGGVKFAADAVVGVYRHDELTPTILEDYANGPEQLEFCSHKITPEQVLEIVADAFYRSEERKTWLKQGGLFVVECEL